jgi:hypothetical protein
MQLHTDLCNRPLHEPGYRRAPPCISIVEPSICPPVSHRHAPMFCIHHGHCGAPFSQCPSPLCRFQSTTTPRSCSLTRHTSTFHTRGPLRRHRSGELPLNHYSSSPLQARVSKVAMLVRHELGSTTVKILVLISHQRAIPRCALWRRRSTPCAPSACTWAALVGRSF